MILANWKSKRLAKEAKNWATVQSASKVKLFRLGKFTVAVGKR